MCSPLKLRLVTYTLLFCCVILTKASYKARFKGMRNIFHLFEVKILQFLCTVQPYSKEQRIVTIFHNLPCFSIKQLLGPYNFTGEFCHIQGNDSNLTYILTERRMNENTVQYLDFQTGHGFYKKRII